MAVQKTKKSTSKRGMRRAHDAIRLETLTENQTSGEVHLRHHVSPTGMYRGRQVVSQSEDED